MIGRGSLDHEVLHGLDQTPLDIPSAGCLHSSVDEPLTTSHGMKEEFLHKVMIKPEIHVWMRSETLTFSA